MPDTRGGKKPFMPSFYEVACKPFLFRLDPEKAHHLVVGGLGIAGRMPGAGGVLSAVWGVPDIPELAVELFGIRFRHPVGLAAGMDKDAKAVRGFAGIGLAFMEVGTVTPLAQPGNDKPRLFRLPADGALINRMGFNNDGATAMAGRLERLGTRPIPLAINIGKNKATPNEEAEEDYRKCLRMLYPYGDLFVVNVSSPNTPDLRRLQHGDDLRRLLDAVREEIRIQSDRQGGPEKPVLVKIAPDNDDEQLEHIARTVAESGIAGIVATNTTVSRERLTDRHAAETGGLSGRPLARRSTEVIRKMYALTEGRLPVIGVGGIFDAADAYEKIRAGASLLEVYTALVYKGPGVVKEICRGLAELLRRDGYARVADAVGADHRQGHR